MILENEAARVFRRLWKSDALAFRDHLLRLPPESRRDRFGMGVSEDFIENYTLCSSAIQNVIYGCFENEILRAVGELRPVNSDRALGIGGDMEAACSVEPDWRNRGVGSQLMQLVLRAAEVRCCRTLYLSFLTSNTAMRRLAMKFDAEIESGHGESTASLHPDCPTPLAIWGKTFDDAKSFAIAALDVQRRKLRTAPESPDQ